MSFILHCLASRLYIDPNLILTVSSNSFFFLCSTKLAPKPRYTFAIPLQKLTIQTAQTLEVDCTKGQQCTATPDTRNPAVSIPSQFFANFIAAVNSPFPSEQFFNAFTELPSCDLAGLPTVSFQLGCSIYSLEPADYVYRVRPLLLVGYPGIYCLASFALEHLLQYLQKL